MESVKKIGIYQTLMKKSRFYKVVFILIAAVFLDMPLCFGGKCSDCHHNGDLKRYVSYFDSDFVRIYCPVCGFDRKETDEEKEVSSNIKCQCPGACDCKPLETLLGQVALNDVENDDVGNGDAGRLEGRDIMLAINNELNEHPDKNGEMSDVINVFDKTSMEVFFEMLGWYGPEYFSFPRYLMSLCYAWARSPEEIPDVSVDSHNLRYASYLVSGLDEKGERPELFGKIPQVQKIIDALSQGERDEIRNLMDKGQTLRTNLVQKDDFWVLPEDSDFEKLLKEESFQGVLIIDVSGISMLGISSCVEGGEKRYNVFDAYTGLYRKKNHSELMKRLKALCSISDVMFIKTHYVPMS